MFSFYYNVGVTFVILPWWPKLQSISSARRRIEFKTTSVPKKIVKLFNGVLMMHSELT